MDLQLSKIAHRRLSWALVMSLLLLTLVLSACGDSGSSSSSTGSTPTVAQSVTIKESKTAGQPTSIRVILPSIND